MCFETAFWYEGHSHSSASYEMLFRGFILKIHFLHPIKQGPLKFQADLETSKDVTSESGEAMTTGKVLR